MVSHETVEAVFLPDRADCVEYLQDQRWADGVRCTNCASRETIKKGTTRKGARRYECRNCERRFNDHTGTIFAEHKLSLPEMFYILSGMETKTTAQLTDELDRTYKTVLTFVQEVQDAVEADALDLPGVCEADEVYVTAGEKRID